MTLNKRAELIAGVLDQLTPWSADERMTAFRSFLRGSLSLTHLHALTVLELRGPLPMGRLAEELNVSVASATGIVGRLEQRRLVERRHDVEDRRVVLVHPTRLGSEVFARLQRHRQRRLRKLLDRLTQEELAAFLVGLQALRRARSGMEPEG